MERKINLDDVVFKNEEVIRLAVRSETGYLAFQECSEEYGIDYYILDKDMNEVDGGEYCYGIYNENTEMYDIPSDRDGVTYRELFEEVNSLNANVQFDENSVLLLDEEQIEEIWDCAG